MTHIRKDFLNDKNISILLESVVRECSRWCRFCTVWDIISQDRTTILGIPSILSGKKMDIPVVLGQKAENIKGADLIVHTAAIMDDNPELIAARESGVPTIERADLLGLVTSWFDNCVCICGTHGKTTTTAMLTQMFMECGMDPSAVVGGKLPAIGGSGRLGKSDIMVCEACEFEDHFFKVPSGYCSYPQCRC